MNALKGILILLVLGVSSIVHSSGNDELDWLRWKLQYNKEYETKESEQTHRRIWERNKAYIEAHDSRDDVTFSMELNHFADQETQKRPILHSADESSFDTSRKTGDELLFLPSSWDWRNKGAVSPVQDQGMTGGVLTIVVTECVDSYHAVHSGNLVDPSEAETMDCCTPQPILSDKIFPCIHNIGGLCSTKAYPSGQGKCMNNSCTAVAQINGGMVVPSGKEDQLLVSVLKTPVLAAIDAGRSSFEFYKSGVYSDPACSTSSLDHVVQVVGYGSLDGTDYWICKNSWGVNWGMKGYVLMARNQGNMCGIATMAMYPV